MCCSYGSIDQATTVCPMCKVFKPSVRCPHIRDVCRNRQNHPRFDVLYLKNAEVQCFNGCGYCKWSNANPPSPTSGYHNNPGWPGCCRPPAGVHEYRMIQPADWHAVTAVHHVPIPHEIKAALDLIVPRTNSSTRETPIRRSSTPPVDRNRSNASLSKSSPTIPSKTFIAPVSRSNKTPQMSSSTLRRDDGHSSPSGGRGSSDPERRRAGTRSSLDNRPSPPTTQRRLNESPARRSIEKPVATAARPSAPPPVVTPKVVVKKPIPIAIASSSSSSSSSGSESDSLGSQTDGTVTSDGGFTDYLSEESEAELQRQAEAKAAVVAQNEMEELEFKAARMKLAQVDLRPPKSWSASNSGGGPPRMAGNSSNTSRYPNGSPVLAAGPSRG